MIELRPASDKDRAFFIRCHHIAYRHTIEQMFDWDAAQQDGIASAKFDAPGTNVIWCKDAQVGVVGIQMEETHLWLRDLFLLPEYQCQGSGSSVIQKVQCQAVQLERQVRLRTLRAKAFYERHGFRVAGQNDLHWHMVWESE